MAERYQYTITRGWYGCRYLEQNLQALSRMDGVSNGATGSVELKKVECLSLESKIISSCGSRVSHELVMRDYYYLVPVPVPYCSYTLHQQQT